MHSIPFRCLFSCLKTFENDPYSVLGWTRFKHLSLKIHQFKQEKKNYITSDLIYSLPVCDVRAKAWCYSTVRRPGQCHTHMSGYLKSSERAQKC